MSVRVPTLFDDLFGPEDESQRTSEPAKKSKKNSPRKKSSEKEKVEDSSTEEHNTSGSDDKSTGTQTGIFEFLVDEQNEQEDTSRSEVDTNPLEILDRQVRIVLPYDFDATPSKPARSPIVFEAAEESQAEPTDLSIGTEFSKNEEQAEQTNPVMEVEDDTSIRDGETMAVSVSQEDTTEEDSEFDIDPAEVEEVERETEKKKETLQEIEPQVLDKRYYTISAVAKMFGVNVSHIRFWTNEFNLRPRTNRKGDRLYTPELIEKIRLIYNLVKVRHYTIKGAKVQLAKGKKKVSSKLELKDQLIELRNQLINLRNTIYGNE